MNPLAVLVSTSLLAAPMQRAAPPPDRWLAEDKLQHGFASLGLVTLTHAGARTISLDATPAIALGIAVSAAAGLGKEILDRRSGRPFSLRDLAWDALGITLGVLLVEQTRK
jgi:uncharacterized protein YfiM (DUF2279 family)